MEIKIDETTGKILLAVTGVIVGWLLKLLSDYLGERRNSNNALFLLEGEFRSILTQAQLLENMVDAANILHGQNPNKAEAVFKDAEQILQNMQLITIYETRFNDFARILGPEELQILMYVVTYYNQMRKAFKQQKPDFSGIRIVTIIIGEQRKISTPFFALFSPLEFQKGKQNIQVAKNEWNSSMKNSTR
jgi:hypothetical protein